MEQNSDWGSPGVAGRTIETTGVLLFWCMEPYNQTKKNVQQQYTEPHNQMCDKNFTVKHPEL